MYQSIANISEKAELALHRWCAGVYVRTDINNNPYVLEVNRTPRLRLGEYSEVIISST